MTITLFTNAKIYTVNEKQPWAEAMAIKDNKILAVGSEEELKGGYAGDAKIVDLQGKMVMPGLADVHNHFVFGGRGELFEVSFPPFFGLDDIIGMVAQAATNTPEGQWIVGGIFGSHLLGEINLEYRLKLDEAAQGRPVMLRDESHHNRWTNKVGLEICGIDDTTQSPENGTIARDAETGEATGLLLEAASALVEDIVITEIKSQTEMNIQCAEHAMKRLNALGITCLQEPLANRTVMDTIKNTADAGLMTSWIVASMPVLQGPFASDEWGKTLFDLRDDYRSEYFRPDFGKLFMDGVPTTHTAAMLDPYLPTDEFGCCFRGDNFMTVPQLARVISDCEKEGISLKIHCTGDSSVRATLDAIEVVRNFNGGEWQHQIAHAGYVNHDDIPRFAELNVVADLSPMIWFPGMIVEQLKTILPEERVTHSFPNKLMLEEGVLIAAGSDWPVLPDPSPWIGMEGIITRKDPSGQVPGEMWPEQGLSLEEALYAYTLGPVRAMGLEKETGSLESGKAADFVVLERNLFEISMDEVSDTKVLATYFAGQLVHEA